MSRIIRGEIETLVPVIRARVVEDALVLDEEGDLLLTVDTGFSGSIALPGELIDGIGAKLVDFGVFRIATGEQIELPVHWGKVVVGDKEVETWFIPGDSLLGMEFLSVIGSTLSLEFERGLLEIVLQ